MNYIVFSRSMADRFFPGEDPVGKEIDLEARMRNFENKHISEDPPFWYSFQSLNDVYLRSDNVANTGRTGNINIIRLFSGVAFLIVLYQAIGASRTNPVDTLRYE